MAFKMKGPTFFKSGLKHKVEQFTDDKTGSREKRDHRFVKDGHYHAEGRLIPARMKKTVKPANKPKE